MTTGKITTCSWQEQPFLFPCGDETLLGTACVPAQASTQGVLIIVGGPQYRVGSHRQFVHLARSLAAAGIPCMRFDVRGMGDSTGAMRSFEEIEDDIAAAVTAFLEHCQGLRSVVLWGLCDGASAACFYAHRDSRVTGLVLANPWVRTTVGQAQTQLRHYYIDRLREMAFWTKLLKGGLDVSGSVRSLLGAVRQAVASASGATEARGASDSLPDRMAASLGEFHGRVLVLISGKDLTAAEFVDTAARSVAWRHSLRRAHTERAEQADHTFSTAEAQAWAERVTRRWMVERV